jgi:hypothetical protein
MRRRANDPAAAELGIAACTQLLNVSWRLGTGLDEARALLEEGQGFAEYPEVATLNERAAVEIGDIGLQRPSSCIARSVRRSERSGSRASLRLDLPRLRTRESERGAILRRLPFRTCEPRARSR